MNFLVFGACTANMAIPITTWDEEFRCWYHCSHGPKLVVEEILYRITETTLWGIDRQTLVIYLQTRCKFPSTSRYQYSKSILMSKLDQSPMQIQVSNAINSSQSGHLATLCPHPSAIRREKPCNEHRAKYPLKLEE